MQDMIEFGILKKKFSKISSNYRKLIIEHKKMIDIVSDDYKNGKIDILIYENDIDYHKNQIKTIRKRIKEIRKAYKLLNTCNDLIKSKKYNSSIFDVGNKKNAEE